MSSTNDNYAIILASGIGERSGLNSPKQFFKVAGQTIFEHSIDIFVKHTKIKEVIVVCHYDYLKYCNEILSKKHYSKLVRIVAGGKTRQDSVYIGLNSIDCSDETKAKVVVHDAVRPFLDSYIIDDCLEALKNYRAVDVAITSSDTLIEVNSDSTIKSIPNRDLFRRGQTPQCFYLDLIKSVHKQALACNDYTASDDCGLIIRYSKESVFVVNGNNFNTKITTPVDVALADKMFQLKTINSDFLEKKELAIFLKNKTIIVIGSSSGIGLSITLLAKEHGSKVIELSRENGCDVSNFESLKKSIATITSQEKKIDAVILTAGILHVGSLENRDLAEIEREIATNYLGAIYVTKLVKPILEPSKGSLILFTSSSYTKGRANYSTYSSSKAALVNFTQAIAEEWADIGIRVNIINPERTATPMRSKNFGNEPAESMLSPKEVAEATLLILNTTFSGQVIDVRRKS